MTDFEGRINRESVRSRQFPFPSMESDMNLTDEKYMCSRSDLNYVLLGVNATEDAWKGLYGIYLLMNYVLTDKFCMELMLIRQGPRNFYVLTRIMY